MLACLPLEYTQVEFDRCLNCLSTPFHLNHSTSMMGDREVEFDRCLPSIFLKVFDVNQFTLKL